PPQDISLLQVVQAVDGDDLAFRCSEIRQRGPAAGPPSAYRRPCGIARAMWRAEEVWRAELASISIGDLIDELVDTVAPELLSKGTAWIRQVDITRRSPK
ncbi:MAG: Rrf2 family transcriptional regulator, partial [Actinomycetota bacterium]|nr:Rrf2 family transcriptional regulator [Actinomycetota bacterium]